MPPPLRVALDVRHARDFGIGTYIANLLRAMAQIGTQERLLLFGRREDLDALGPLPENFEHHLFSRPDRGLTHQLAFPLFYRSLKADLGHVPLNLVPLAMPKPYVVTVHDLSRLKYPTETPGRQRYDLFRARRGLARAERVIAVSESTKQDVEELLGIPSESITRVYNAIDPRFLEGGPRCLERRPGQTAVEQADSTTRQVLERFGIQHPYLLYAGTIRQQKNLPRLVETFALLRGELASHPVYGDLRLVIIGDEISRHPELRRTVAQTRVEPFVRFLGFVPFEVLRAFYSAAEVFVFPSLDEGFGLPPLEAMACGAPVVTSNQSSLPEVVGDAAATVSPENVFEIARAVKEVLLDADLRVEMVARGFERLRFFNWRDTAEAVLRIYREAARR